MKLTLIFVKDLRIIDNEGKLKNMFTIIEKINVVRKTVDKINSNNVFVQD